MHGIAAGGIICDLLWRGKCLKIGGEGGGWCQVLEEIFGALGVIEEIKSPWGGRGSGD